MRWTMVDWQALEGIGGVATAGALVVALAFGVVQWRQGVHHRRDASTVEMIHAFQTPEVLGAFRSVLALPEPVDPARVNEQPDVVNAAVTTIFTCETLGCMVFERVLDLHVLDRLWGGFIRAAWRRLAPWIRAERERLGVGSFGEWFEWLVAQLEAHPEPSKSTGAHVAYARWRP